MEVEEEEMTIDFLCYVLDAIAMVIVGHSLALLLLLCLAKIALRYHIYDTVVLQELSDNDLRQSEDDFDYDDNTYGSGVKLLQLNNANLSFGTLSDHQTVADFLVQVLRESYYDTVINVGLDFDIDDGLRLTFTDDDQTMTTNVFFTGDLLAVGFEMDENLIYYLFFYGLWLVLINLNSHN